jgi:hypothetical protein
VQPSQADTSGYRIPSGENEALKLKVSILEQRMALMDSSIKGLMTAVGLLTDIVSGKEQDAT